MNLSTLEVSQLKDFLQPFMEIITKGSELNMTESLKMWAEKQQDQYYTQPSDQAHFWLSAFVVEVEKRIRLESRFRTSDAIAGVLDRLVREFDLGDQ